jgi:galactose mutarotase-like enzyme
MLRRMFSVRLQESGSPTIGDLVVLEDEAHASSVAIAPGRGAIVTSFSVGGREVLYLDEATFLDTKKNVRGGVPVLFPSPGKLAGDAWSHGGKTWPMKQHGFARELPWVVESQAREGAASVVLRLDASEHTRASYPFDFRATLTFTLRGHRLHIEQRIENRGDAPMPFAIGFHPYFRVEDKAGARIPTSAKRAFDNVSKQTGPFAGFDLTRPEVDVALLDHPAHALPLQLSDGTQVVLRASEDFGTWVVWTLAGKDFVCVEPWTASGNALNGGEHLLVVPPGGAWSGFVEIEAHHPLPVAR